jgi:cholest-4-en-3-one 26-monooxygenase
MPEDALALIRTMMVNMDPPMHTKYRRLVSTGFTPKMIRAMEPHVREITREILDQAAARETCDFVTDIAAQLPLAVIAELMGVPAEDRHKVFDWSNRPSASTTLSSTPRRRTDASPRQSCSCTPTTSPSSARRARRTTSSAC